MHKNLNYLFLLSWIALASPSFASEDELKETITVRTIKGQNIQLDVNLEHTTIKKLKTIIQTKEGTPPEEQRLVYQSIELEGKKTLHDYDIPNGSELLLSCKVVDPTPNDNDIMNNEIKSNTNNRKNSNVINNNDDDSDHGFKPMHLYSAVFVLLLGVLTAYWFNQNNQKTIKKGDQNKLLVMIKKL